MMLIPCLFLLLATSVYSSTTGDQTSTASTPPAATTASSTTTAPQNCVSIEVANGTWKNTTGSTTVNSTATLECHPGYEPSNNNTTIICQNNGTWNSSATPICKVRDCGGFASIEVDNGIWKNTTGSTTVNSTATLECNSGYEPSNNNTTIICQNNGTWNSSEAPKCEVRDCGFPSNTSVVNGTWNTNDPTKVNSTATLECYSGYQPSNTSRTNITCQDDGNWNNLTATCELMKLAYNDTCYINNPEQCRSQNAECKNMTVEENSRCHCSSEFFTYSNTTDKCAPTIPEDVNLTVQNGDVHNTFITLTLNACSNKSHIYSAHIYPVNNNSKQVFNCSTEESPENQTSTTVFEGLSSGTQYTFILVLSVDGVTSHTNKTIVQYTKPHTPDFVSLSSITETTMNITWGFSSTQVGQYDEFSISVSPDIVSNIPKQNKTTTSYTLSNLKGGTVYTISVSSLLGNLSSETPQTVTGCTYPTPPNNGYIFSQETDSIEIRYNNTGDIIDMYSIGYNGSNFTSNGSEETNRVLTISGLQQGSNYTFYVSSLTCGKQSLESETIEAFTKPGPPSSINISEQTETTLTVEWSAPSGGVNSYRVWLRRQGQETDAKMEAETASYQFKNLTAGTDYTVYVQTVWRGLTSTETSISTYTASSMPELVFEIAKDGIHETNLSADFGNGCGEERENYMYTIFLKNNTHYVDELFVINCSSDSDNKTYTFTELMPGTYYTFDLTLKVHGLQSDTNRTFSQYTRPKTPDFITLSFVTVSSMNVTWGFNTPLIGRIDEFRLSVSADTDNRNPIMTEINTTTSYYLENLRGGILYTVNVYSMIDKLSSEAAQTATECTHPAPPQNGYVSRQENHTILIAYNATEEKIEQYNIFYNGTNFTTNSSQNEAAVLNISGLQEGTNYTFDVTSLTCNKQSLTSQKIETYTRPGDPLNVSISDQTQTSINASWSAPCCGVDYFTIWLTTQGSVAVLHQSTVNTTFHEFKGLTAGTTYTVHVQTFWRGLSSAVTSSSSSHTAPGNFTVNTTGIAETTLDFNVIDPADNYTYNFTLTDTRTNKSNMSQGEAVQFTDLVPGRLYRLTVIATVGLVDSISPIIVMVNTRPGRVENITIDEEKTSNTIMAISWGNPSGDFDNVTVSFNCTSPNRDLFTNCLKQHDNDTTTANCSGLDPGTFCKIEIQTKSGFQAGDIVYHNISKSTREEAPSSVTNLTSTHLSRSITVIWRKPSMPNGFIRKYKVIVEDNTGECNNKRIVRYINCTNCRDEAESVGGECQTTTVDYAVNETAIESVRQVFSDTMHAKFTSLVPGRMYTVTVIPYTKCWGPTTVVSIWTDEEEPKGPPISINSSATQDSVTIYWEAPLCEDITGNITSYNVTVNYTDTSCYPNGTAIIKSFTTISQWFVLNGTQAYNNYTYTITAATAFGLGPPSLPTTQRTQAKAPGPVRSPTNTTITDTSVDLAWEHPCFPNGVFSSYNVTIKNRDTGELRNESSNNSSISIDKLLPYRNYTFGVVQYNEGGLAGDPEYINITTEQGVPHSIRDLHNSSRNGSSITVSWSPPDLYTGVTNYMVNCVDDHFKNLTQKEVWGFNSTELTVTDLRAYWNYTISVEAKTVAGSNNSSVINVRTKETVPGPIANLTLSPETNVTKPRTVTVVWQEPKLEDKNGVITGYVIRYGYNNSEMTNVSVSGTKTVLPNLSTGYITIKVAAKTSVGEGEVISNGTDVLPGAPLKLNESEQSLLQPSRQGVPDSERQISIMLPLRSFFCNYTNGMTTRWGLVVAETARIGGNKPYNGDVNGFKKTLESYRKWKDIKEADVIDPYIPTSSDWNPCDKADPKYRSRRSVPNVVDMPFVIGADKECDAPDHLGFCNGQLAPGRSYSVRGFVCTEGGCTESKYSPAIWTDPDLTAHIVAGVVSAVVVILVGVVVIVFMKRRQMACFAKKIERPKNVNLNGTEATEMKETVTKTHTFKPCSVRLSEFPGHVTDMHKDSNLLFADAFVMVKEKSPALSSSMAESQACRPKNRYTNILSFDHSRVKLLPLEDVEGSDFINANYIPGCKSKRAYIATQGPLPATFDDFWRMIWEQNVGVIVMLTKLVEKGRNKCDMYWPNLGEPVFFGDIVACTKSESTLSDYTLRVIELKLKDNVRMVRQFCFLKWPDMGCPDHPYLLLDFVKDVRNEYKPEVEKRGPMVVHCSAGVGRTGTFIAVDNLLQYVKEKDTVDIYNLVLEMRQNRCHMVQTEDQFIYIYECLKEFLTVKKEEEVVVVEEEPVYENTGDGVYENMGFSSS